MINGASTPVVVYFTKERLDSIKELAIRVIEEILIKNISGGRTQIL